MNYRMKAVVLLFCLLIPTLAVASPITYDLTGNLGDANLIRLSSLAWSWSCRSCTGGKAGDEALDQIILKRTL
jgi:hypothetical protein